MYKSINRILPLIPHCVVREKMGRTIITSGILIARIRLPRTCLLPLKTNRDSTYAAGAEISSTKKQDTTEYSREFPKNTDTFCVFHAVT